MSKHIARKRFGQNFLIDVQVIGAIVDAVAPSQSGHLVTPGDYPALAQAALQVLADSPGAWQARASAFAAQFAWPVLGQKLGDILQAGTNPQAKD